MKHGIFGKASVIGAAMAASMVLSGCGMNYVGSSGTMGEGSSAIAGADISSETIDQVVLLGPDNLVVTKGSSAIISASGDEDVVKLLRYEMEGSTLRIGRSKEKGDWSDSSATINLTLPTLNGIRLAGSGDAQVDEISGEEADISLAGSGDMTIKSLIAKSVDVKIAGSGNINLSGNGETSKFSIAGSGDIKAEDYKTDNANLKIAGSGNIAVASDGEVDAKIMGSGDINVIGKAKCKSKSMGSGDFSCG